VILYFIKDNRKVENIQLAFYLHVPLHYYSFLIRGYIGGLKVFINTLKTISIRVSGIGVL